VVVDASGMIVMPGFVDTHHHQYETIPRGIFADGVLGSANDGKKTYQGVIQGIFTPDSCCWCARRPSPHRSRPCRFGGDVFLDEILLIQINPRVLLLHRVHRNDRRRGSTDPLSRR
jgi:hypothetical protein